MPAHVRGRRFLTKEYSWIKIERRK